MRKMFANDFSIDIKKILNDFSFKIAGNSFLTKFSSLIITLVTTSLLGISAFGSLQYSLSVVMLISSIGLAGFPSIITKKADRLTSLWQLKKYLSSSFLLVTTSGVYFLYFNSTFQSNILNKNLVNSHQISNFLFLLLIWSYLLCFNSLLIAVPNGLLASNLIMRMGFVRLFLSLILSMAITLSQPDLYQLCFLFCGVEAIYLIASILLVTGYISKDKKIPSASLSEDREYQVLMLSSFAGILLSFGMFLVQTRVFQGSEGAIDNGKFNLLIKLSVIVTFLSTAISTSFLSKLPSGAFAVKDEIRKFLIYSSIWITFSLSMISLVLRVTESLKGDLLRVISLLLLYSIAVICNNLFSSLSLALNFVRTWALSDLVLAFFLVILSSFSRGSTSAIVVTSISLIGSALFIATSRGFRLMPAESRVRSAK